MSGKPVTSANTGPPDNFRAYSPQTAGDSRLQPDTQGPAEMLPTIEPSSPTTMDEPTGSGDDRSVRVTVTSACGSPDPSVVRDLVHIPSLRLKGAPPRAASPPSTTARAGHHDRPPRCVPGPRHQGGVPGQPRGGLAADLILALLVLLPARLEQAIQRIRELVVVDVASIWRTSMLLPSPSSHGSIIGWMSRPAH